MLSYSPALRRGTNNQLYHFILDSLRTFKKIVHNSKLISHLDQSKLTADESWKVLTCNSQDMYPSAAHFIYHIQYVFLEFSNHVDLNQMVNLLVS
jgi:hypothetical protein